jgi:hypothetical protein
MFAAQLEVDSLDGTSKTQKRDQGRPAYTLTCSRERNLIVPQSLANGRFRPCNSARDRLEAEAAMVCLWPVVRTQHVVRKPSFAQKENNQTSINNEGVCHGIH